MNTPDADTHRSPTFVEAVRVCFVKYADFRGCASRPEFWWFVLFNLVASIALGVVSDNLSLAFSLATLLPFAAVTTRRLHDANKSGWLQLIGIIPIIGWIVLIVWCTQASRPNPYGRS